MMSPMKRLLPAVLSLLTILFPINAAFAAGVYPSGSTGWDISYPQCGGSYPGGGSFHIAGVTDGKAFTNNPCLASEFSWASAAAVAPSLYMNLNAPIGPTASFGNTGPAGTCRKGDKSCQSYNYGYNAATSAWNYAASQGASSANWWLDIETANSWFSRKSLNDRAIAGAADLLRSRGANVGVYSTNYMWSKIAGSYRPGLPVWYGSPTNLSGAPGYCGSGYNFAGGGVYLVQYSGGSFDADYAC